ncbi:hypothetical protein D5S18_19305 [Nocardia panacis]|uniref:Uncharacterized protein n=1 Tax=Nocardia panacis TaxID=2340916 RepID=A0A3A4KU44_9NOCA|nr:hypothetical protein D5S18_19305 [Nocardia panacis]
MGAGSEIVTGAAASASAISPATSIATAAAAIANRRNVFDRMTTPFAVLPDGNSTGRGGREIGELVAHFKI